MSLFPFQLLTPHLKYTLEINCRARSQLVSHDGIFKRVSFSYREIWIEVTWKYLTILMSFTERVYVILNISTKNELCKYRTFKKQKPMRLKLHMLKLVFIIYNICFTCSPLFPTHFLHISFLGILLSMCHKISPLIADFFWHSIDQ